MTGSGSGEALTLRMSVTGYQVRYVRQKTADPSAPVVSQLGLSLSVTGATVEHHQNGPIKLVTLVFSEGPFNTERAGNIDAQSPDNIAIFARLPWADFAGIWAALRLEGVARLECLIERGTDHVLVVQVDSPAFAVPS